MQSFGSPGSRAAKRLGTSSRWMAAYLKPSCDKDEMMQRICFVLQVKPDRLEEYKERHRYVWPDMQAALRETGWGNYSLFLRDDGLLVGYLETPDFRQALEGMAAREVNERWQRDMAHFSEHLDGRRPDQALLRLAQILHPDSTPGITASTP